MVVKKRLGFCIIVSAILLLSLSACRNKNESVFGVIEETDHKTIVQGTVDFDHQSFNSLTIQGTADLEDVTVKNDLVVQGSLEAEDCLLHNITVYGNVALEETKVSGKTQVFGRAEFDECSLQQVEIISKKAVFEECTALSVIVKGTEVGSTIILNNTQILGDLLFEKGEGKVRLEGDSEVKGNIIGAMIIE